MNEITKDLLREISEWDGAFKGAYNIREDGQCAGRVSSKNIRIISLCDSLDSSDELFPKLGTKNTLDAIANMTVAKGQAAFDDFQAELLSDKYHEKKLKKYRMVINMYNAGYSIKEIMSRTGYHGKSNIYRILHMFNVELEYPTMVRSKLPGVGVTMRNL